MECFDDGGEGLADLAREGEACFYVRGVEKGESRGLPKMASMIWSVSLSAEGKSFVKEMLRFFSWVERRWMGV